MIRIDYQTYNQFWLTAFAKDKNEAEYIRFMLKTLKHVTKVKPVDSKGENPSTGKSGEAS